MMGNSKTGLSSNATLMFPVRYDTSIPVVVPTPEQDDASEKVRSAVLTFVPLWCIVYCATLGCEQ